jgi:hypothetical protein
MYKHPITAGALLALLASFNTGTLAAGFGGGPGGYQVPGYSGPAYGQPAPGYQIPDYQGPAYGGAPNMPRNTGYGVPGGYPQGGAAPGYGANQGRYGYPTPGAGSQGGYGYPPAGAPQRGYGGAPGYGDQGGYGYGAPGVYGPGYGEGAPGGYGPQGYSGYGPGPGDYSEDRGRRDRDGGGSGSGFNPMKVMPNPMKMFGGKKD